jgi:MoaA/NifB/PqqE/SkfB family radical SAM enzyme
MSLDTVKRKIDFLVAHGAGILTLTGGEPTLRGDILDIVEYAKERNLDVELQTNGTLLADGEFAGRLIDAGVDCFLVSLHTHDKNLYRTLAGVDLFDAVVAGIENLTGRGANVSVSHVINALNYRELGNFTKYAGGILNIRNIYFALIRANHRGGEFTPRLSEIEKYIYGTFELCRESDIYFEVEGLPMCYMAGYEEHNIESLRLSWQPRWHIEENKRRNDTHRRNFENHKAAGTHCTGCTHEKLCPKVWKEYAAIHGTAELHPRRLTCPP